MHVQWQIEQETIIIISRFTQNNIPVSQQQTFVENQTFHAAHFWMERKTCRNTCRHSSELHFLKTKIEKDRAGLRGREVKIEHIYWYRTAAVCPQTHPSHCSQRWLIQAPHSWLKGVTVVWQQRAKRPSIIVVCGRLSNWQQWRHTG